MILSKKQNNFNKYKPNNNYDRLKITLIKKLSIVVRPIAGEGSEKHYMSFFKTYFTEDSIRTFNAITYLGLGPHNSFNFQKLI